MRFWTGLALLLGVWSAGCERREPAAGLWYAKDVSVPSAVVQRLGGPLSQQEMDSLISTSRDEVRRAFAGLRIRVAEDSRAVWRVEVVNHVPTRGGLSAAGESHHFGLFGGTGVVGFEVLSLGAIEYMPSNAPRQQVIEAIGRGVGRAAAHEFAHQILGRSMGEDEIDVNSYEYFSADRSSQFVGDLHWNAACPGLKAKLGR